LEINFRLRLLGASRREEEKSEADGGGLLGEAESKPAPFEKAKAKGCGTRRLRVSAVLQGQHVLVLYRSCFSDNSGIVSPGHQPLRESLMSPWIKKYSLSKEEVAQILDDFLAGTGSPVAWDGFTLAMCLENDSLEKIRLRCLGLSEEFPPEHRNEYCNQQGRDVIREYIKQLRSNG
jgi:hypothetical protein